jgi:hypothetical protein
METKELLLKKVKEGVHDLERALRDGSQEKVAEAISFIRYHLTYLELTLPYLC